MSNHHGPENGAPDEQRCEAMVRGTGNARYFLWTRYDRRCSKRVNQSRDGLAVCHVHAKIETLERWNGTGQ